MTMTFTLTVDDDCELDTEPFEAARHLWGIDVVCWLCVNERSREVQLPDTIDGLIVGEDMGRSEWVDRLLAEAVNQNLLVVDYRAEDDPADSELEFSIT
jgi:hypothetical protein